MTRKQDDVGLDDNFLAIGIELFQSIPWKRSFFLGLFMVLVFSDFFVLNVLGRLNGAVNIGYPTTRGTLIQIMIVLAFFVLIDLLIEYDIM